MPELFGVMPDGSPVHRVTLSTNVLRVRVLTFGAAIQSIELRVGDNEWVNLALGLATLEEYVAHSPHFGAVPGRYAGRIAKAQFSLEGRTYYLDANDGPNTRHGGTEGFGKRNWNLRDHTSHRLTLALTSPDGDCGFPGEVDVLVHYAVDGAELRIDYEATTTQSTVLNLTNHTYFNLAGEGSGDVTQHELTIASDEFTPTDSESIPTGEVRQVAHTPFDFRAATPIGSRIRHAAPQLLLARGYDHSFIIRGSGLRQAALLRDPTSCRTLEVMSSEPALHLYTANMLNGSLTGLSGRTFRQSDAVCLESQHLANSLNEPAFPSTTLYPEVPFHSTTIFRFGMS